MLEGDEVGPDGACVLERAGLSPAEGLAGGEGEGQGKLRLGEVERDPRPLGGVHRGFGGVRAMGFGDGFWLWGWWRDGFWLWGWWWWWWDGFRFESLAHDWERTGFQGVHIRWLWELGFSIEISLSLSLRMLCLERERERERLVIGISSVHRLLFLSHVPPRPRRAAATVGRKG